MAEWESHGLKRLTLTNPLRTANVPFSQMLTLVLDLEPVLNTDGKGKASMFRPFAQLESLTLNKITIEDEESTTAFL